MSFDASSLWSGHSNSGTEASTIRGEVSSIRTDATSTITDDEPTKMISKEKLWYYESVHPAEYTRRSRDMLRHYSLRCYLPVVEAENQVAFPMMTDYLYYRNEVFLFEKTWTVEDLTREVNSAKAIFEKLFLFKQYEDACYIGTIIVNHFILLLRPEEGEEKRKNVLASFKNRISGKICYPEGDLLIIPRRKWDNDQGMLAGICHALLYLQKVMAAVNLLPGAHITSLQQLLKSRTSAIKNRGFSLGMLKEFNLPEASFSRGVVLRKKDPNLSSLSLFFRPLFSSRYILIENEKTRYTIETLQLAFVAFQQLADTAMWSKEYAYALFLIQNMWLIVKYLEIVLPLPELLHRSMLFVFPEFREKCLLLSAEGYLLVKIPPYWKRSCVQQNFAILFYCNKKLLYWEDSIRSSELEFLFKERKSQLYSVLEALCWVWTIHLESMLLVTLNLLKAKCLFYLSILDVSRLINWRRSGQSSTFLMNNPSFETILALSEADLDVDDCEVHAAASFEPVKPVVHNGVKRRVIYQISNIPVAVSNILKANQYRSKGFASMPTRKSMYLDFSNQLYTAMSSNIMIHYINLQEYETDLDVPCQMTGDFGDLLDRKYDSKYLTQDDGPMLNKTIAFLFMGGCLVFYLMYRLGGDSTFYYNSRYFYALMSSLVIKFDLCQPVLKSLAEHAEMRKLLLLDCHVDLRREPDRCVAVIRSYLHMLPLLYEVCILRKTKGGPTNCPRIRVREVTFPFNVSASQRSDSGADITILQRVKDYLRRELQSVEIGEIITLLEPAGYSTEHYMDETLQFKCQLTAEFTQSVPKYPVLDRWSWRKPMVDSRPMCTGHDDCESAPCTVEEYIDEEETDVAATINLVDEPNFLNELVNLNKDYSMNLSTLSDTLAHVRESLKSVTEKLWHSINKIHQLGMNNEEHYVRVCIPGPNSDQSRAVPNDKMDDLPLHFFLQVLKRSIGYLSDDYLPDDLALCKALLCLDRLLNHEFRISQLLRGSIEDLEDILSS